MAKIEIVTKDDLEALKVELLKEFKVLVGVESLDIKWLRSSEVLELLNISSGTLKSLRESGEIPFSKLGGSLYYNYNDLVAVLEANKR